MILLRKAENLKAEFSKVRKPQKAKKLIKQKICLHRALSGPLF